MPTAMKTLFSLTACLLALTLTPPPLVSEAHSGSGRFPISGRLCPSIDLFLPDLTPIIDGDRGGGAEALIIWAGGGERVERFIHDGDPISSSGLPPTMAGIGALTPRWLRSNFPEAAEGARLWYDGATVGITWRLRPEFVKADRGALLVCGGDNGTIWLLLGEEMNNGAAMVIDFFDCSDWDINPNTDTKRLWWLGWIQKTPAVRRRRIKGARRWVSSSNRVLMILGFCGGHFTIFSELKSEACSWVDLEP